MNFFEHQDNARKKTKWLILAFGVAVLAIIVAVNLLVIAAMASSDMSEGSGIAPLSSEWLQANWTVMLWTSLAVGGVIGAASLWKIATLSGGGGVVARSMGGTLVPTDVRDLARRRLRNVVEEVAIASGVPVPEIYVLEKEAGINAFAAGFSTGDAAVAVSRGCLETLTREELQGVIAHEFSHIFNGDMRLNIKLMGILFGILMIGMGGRHLMRVSYYGGGNKKDGMPLVVVGLALMAIGFIGLFFGRWIQAAVSRQREYLADASAVQFTRNPEGIGGALKKISALSVGSYLESEETEEVAHMLFSSGVSRLMMATHPKLEDRIKAIDPHFEPTQLGDIAARLAASPAPLLSESGAGGPAARSSGNVLGGVLGGAVGGAMGGAIGAGRAAGFTAGAAAPDGQATVSDQDWVDQVGTISWDHVAYAAAERNNLPEDLLEAVHSLHTSIDVVLAALVDGRPEVQQRQLQIIEDELDHDHHERVREFLPQVQQLDPLQRLPLVELAFPALRRRPGSSIRRYLKTIDQLIHADGQIDIFEFSLSKLISVYLLEAMQPARQAGKDQNLKIRDVRDELNLIFSLLAQVGNEGTLEIHRALAAGMLHIFSMETDEYQQLDNWVDRISAALNLADRLVPLDKEIVLEGLIKTLAHDGQITLAEVELLRAICAAIHCPMPPKLVAA